ncbi:DUF4401 domain-containing protein [Psychrobacter sp. B38]
MNEDKQALTQLKDLGLVEAKLADDYLAYSPSAPSASNNAMSDRRKAKDDPWFLQLSFGFSGILASLLFIGFVNLILNSTGVLDSAALTGIVGLLLSLVGFLLFKYERTRGSTFLNSLAFTIGVAGQAYVIYALTSGDIEHPFDIWLFLLLQSALTLIFPSFMYRLLSSWSVLVCTVYLLDYYHLPEVSLGLLALMVVVSHLQRYKLLQRVPMKWQAEGVDIIKAVGYGSALVLLGISVYFIAAESGHRFDSYGETPSYNYYWAQGLLTLASLYAAFLILARYRIKWRSVVGLLVGVTIAVLGVLSIYVSGLLATSLIIVIAMANSQRTLLGVGIFALVGYIFWYYYQLDTSLLVKSASMLVVGIALLLVRFLLIKRYFAQRRTHSASNNKERLS